MTDLKGEDGTDKADEAPAEETDRLQALEEDIEEVRRKVADSLDQGGRNFIEEGEADEDQPVDDQPVDDQPVDDTIVPPG